MLFLVFYKAFQAWIRNRSEEAFYYAKEILKAKQEGRITKVSHDVYVECFTAWDLGIGLNRYLDFSSTKK